MFEMSEVYASGWYDIGIRTFEFALKKFNLLVIQTWTIQRLCKRLSCIRCFSFCKIHKKLYFQSLKDGLKNYSHKVTLQPEFTESENPTSDQISVCSWLCQVWNFVKELSLTTNSGSRSRRPSLFHNINSAKWNNLSFKFKGP